MVLLLTALVVNAAPLGAPPLCEPSGATLLPENRVVVVDNEREESLFLFEISDSGLVNQRQVALPNPEVRDIEAVVYGDGFLGLIGSHSHKRYTETGQPNCPESTRRMTIGIVPIEGLVLGEPRWIRSNSSSLLKGQRSCLKVLFDNQNVTGASQFCHGLVTAEANSEESAPHCQATLNIEGAALVGDRLWLGLRSPRTMAGAALVRVKGGWPDQIGGLVLDRVVMLQTPSLQGIRALTVSEGHLYGVSGPVLDSSAPFSRWRLSLERLEHDLMPAVDILSDVANSAEGVVVSGGVSYGVIDGAEDKGDHDRCNQPALQWLAEVP